MANLCLGALATVRDFLLSSAGINAALGEISARDRVYLTPVTEESTVIENVSPKTADENEPTVYPAIYLYCDRMDNELLEKFRKFSGRVWLAADVRVSEERFVDLGAQLARYVEGVTTVLGKNLGKWTDNLAYNGSHKVKFMPVEDGGRNFIQRAKVEVELQAHE